MRVCVAVVELAAAARPPRPLRLVAPENQARGPHCLTEEGARVRYHQNFPSPPALPPQPPPAAKHTASSPPAPGSQAQDQIRSDQEVCLVLVLCDRPPWCDLIPGSGKERITEAGMKRVLSIIYSTYQARARARAFCSEHSTAVDRRRGGGAGVVLPMT